MLNEATQLTGQICWFPDDREIPPDALCGILVKLSEMTLQHPRVFGDCWLACRLWGELQLGPFWRWHLPDGKAEVPWFKVLELLTVRQRVAPGSKWHRHRRWFLSSAMDPWLGEDFAVAAKNRLDECLDRIDAHRAELFTHLQARWEDLFGATYDLLLYDLTSTILKGIWIMDRGIPTKETLREMRQSDPPVSYLVGTPRARWDQFKDEFVKVPWQKLRDTVEVKLLAHGQEVYVLAKSQGRRAKEIAIRRRKLAKLLRSLRALRRTRQRPWKRDTLLHKLGAAHKEAGRAWGFVKITVPKARQPVHRDTFQLELLKD